ncbi:MAG: heparin lyase I family protein, partial [Betaproteobacteria bacterium]
TIANGTSAASGPTVQFTAPAEGGALSGNVQGPPNCVVTGSNIARVMFYLNDAWTNTDGNLDNGLGCWIDATKYPDGSYTVKAVAYDAAGRTATATRGIVIKNAAAQNVPPSVSFKAPTSGATLKGLVNSTTCEAAASDGDGSVQKVDFYLGTAFVNSKTAAPWQCNLDTTKFQDGAHTLMAVATDNLGASASTQVGVSIDNSTSSDGGSSGSAISAGDIVYWASADTLFSQQSGYTAQVIGTYTSAPSIPETGIHGTVLSNGDSLRLGKSADPVDSSRKTLTFQLGPNDPKTSGSIRSELSFAPKIEHDKVYWNALRTYVHDYGTLPSSESFVIGTQLHSGDNSRGLSPSFSIISNGGSTFQIYALYSTSSSPSQGNTVTTRSPKFAMPFGRWVDFVFKFKQNTSGGGFLQVWMDGTQIVDYQGSLGFNTPGYKDYMKFGYYNWSAFNTPRKVQLRSPVTVIDPTGSKYKPEDLRAYIRAQP